MRKVSFTIDGKTVTAAEGEKVLWAALNNNIYIPNLCALRDKMEPDAACRLCFVEIEGKPSLVTACTEPVADGMVVNTKGTNALALVKTGFELLMASHQLDCAHCAINGSCELQKIAKHLKVSLKPKQLRSLPRNLPVDESNPLFIYNPNKCVLCGRCIWVCRQNGSDVLGFARRGFKRMVTTFGGEPIGNRCLQCTRCVEICPAGALVFKEREKAQGQG